MLEGTLESNVLQKEIRDDDEYILFVSDMPIKLMYSAAVYVQNTDKEVHAACAFSLQGDCKTKTIVFSVHV